MTHLFLLSENVLERMTGMPSRTNASNSAPCLEVVPTAGGCLLVIGSLDMTAGLPKDLERYEGSASKPSDAEQSSVDSD